MAIAALGPGMELAGYRLERVLGQGGMGVVYEATQLSLDRTVALKIVAPSLSADIGFRARFRREGLSQARLDHPNIVTVYEAGESEETLFLAMQLIRGSSLKEAIGGGELDPTASLRILAPVADALDTAHQEGFIHRDVKPHNILLGAKGRPYLADFGLMKTAEDTGLTRTGQFLGSLDYISPEQIHNEQITGASDIYSLGAVLFECLTGTVPYPKESDAAILYAHVAEPLPSTRMARPELPEALDDVLARAMAKRPSERQASATELILEAENVIKTSAVGSRSSSSSKGSSEPDGSNLSGAQSGLAETQVDPALEGTRKRAGASTTSAPLRAVTAQRRASLVIACVVLVALSIGGFALGKTNGSKEGEALARHPVVAGRALLTVPRSWSNLAGVTSIMGLSLSDPSAMSDRSHGGEILTGFLPGAEGAELLPAAFVAHLASRPKPNDPVHLAGGSAYRYRGLSVDGLAKTLTLFVMPTDSGVLAVACLASSSTSAAFMRSCEQAAGTLRPVGLHVLDLGPSRDYAEQLSSAVTDLHTAQSYVVSLSHARSPKGQASLCGKLEHAYSAIAERLAKSTPGPDAAAINARLVAVLRGASEGYGSMSKSAGQGSEAAYDAGRRRTAKETGKMRTQLELLRSLGY